MQRTTKSVISMIVLLMIPLFVDAGEVRVGFSPSGSAQKLVLEAIGEARVSVDLAAYSFTSKPVSLALLQAKKRGVLVRVVADKKANDDRYTAVTFLVHKGIEVRLNGNYAIQHNKFLVVDAKSVQTGSMNYTKSGDSRNAENVVYLRDMPETAKQYTREFNRLWAESERIDAEY
ncbi:Phospholipase D precursor [Serratia ficaria]|uniref:phospholipase D family nuclease n=1 Tax=Serratia ficaria TaxID=61651 RepID=UPI0021772E1F|nr:phospholipase D family protein [Serratia ficaria]CAI1207593.1 Phospholipase D precursor [Serratia ficaria]CAI2010129.1 Phospholipase D precursor [Serratia ficaria]CAI2534508.1 Phospholipase D precursor [Serratia ficaria]